MTEYTELIRSLKACEHDECYPERCDWFGKYQVDLRCKNILLANAAAAIEELQALLTEADKKQTYQHDCICELTAENEELQAEVEKWTFNATLEQSKAIANFESYCKLKAQLPKRGEIVRCKECIHFAQGGWCDREFDWFPVDENDFCSMAEKMEVQE